MADLKYITTTFLLPQKQYLRMLLIYMHSDQKTEGKQASRQQEAEGSTGKWVWLVVHEFGPLIFTN